MTHLQAQSQPRLPKMSYEQQRLYNLTRQLDLASQPPQPEENLEVTILRSIGQQKRRQQRIESSRLEIDDTRHGPEGWIP